MGTVSGWSNDWQLQGDEGLAQLAQRLRRIGTPQPMAAPQGRPIERPMGGSAQTVTGRRPGHMAM